MFELAIAKTEYTTSLDSEDNSKKTNDPDGLNIEIGNKVKIKRIRKESLEPEDYYYLKKFEDKIGTISEQNECKSGVYTYKVEFDQNKFGYFYYEDFIVINS